MGIGCKIKMNGKATAIATLFAFGISAIVGYGELRGKVSNLEKDVEQVEKTPIEVAVIKTKVEELKKDFGEFKVEQKEMKTDIKEILNRLPR